MRTFGEQLTDARKAAGMTQEELAQTVHVTRTTVSSWERGRTAPDLDTVRLLSQTLRHDFIGDRPVADAAPEDSPAEGPENPAEETPEASGEARPAAPEPEAPAPGDADGEPPDRPAARRLPAAVACGGVLALLVLIFFVWILPGLRNGDGGQTPAAVTALPTGSPAAATPAPPPISGRDLSLYPEAVEVAPEDLLLHEPKRLLPGWFRAGNVRAVGEPWLDIHTEVIYTPPDERNSYAYWRYILTFEEVTGEPFRFDHLLLYTFGTETSYTSASFGPNAVQQTGDNARSWRMNGMLPVQEMEGFGYLIYGYDDAGHPMSFRTYIDMTEAPRE